MSTISPTRPSRRAATQRKVVMDDSDEENSIVKNRDDDEEEYTPAARRSPRRSSRRTTTEPPTTPKSMTNARSLKIRESIEPSQVFGIEEISRQEGSPTKRGSPRKRKSAVITRKPRATVAAAELPFSSVPKISEEEDAAPLSDITQATINAFAPQTAFLDDKVATKDLGVVLEKPMDIVLRSKVLPPPVQEDSTPRPRTVIKNLILTNFKSYAGRQEVGPFHASFSSVVGPNGSGKSNVIDSLLFVFGFRASKMRQGKISALIHNSGAFPNLEWCEVEVHFQEVMDKPGGGHEIMPGSDLVISRRAFKNNSSKYYINTKESTFTDVTSLLKARGVDLDHKRFLILQGEVESIAQMKPKAANEHDDGLLEYLEDIIGTSKYKTPIEQSAAEVDALNEVCTEKVARVQHVEKEKSSLEEKKEKALSYVRDENDLASKQSALYQIYIQECGGNIQVTNEAIQEMQSKLNTELDKHQGSEDGIKGLEKAYKSGSKDYEILQKETQAVLKEMAKHDRENVKHEEKRKFLSNKQAKLEKALHTSRLAGSESQSLVQKHSDDFVRKNQEVLMLEKEKEKEESELTSIRESLHGKTQAFSDEIVTKQKLLEPWNEKISEKTSAIALAQSELAIFREKVSAGSVALEEAQLKVEAIKKSRSSKKQETNELRSQKTQTERRIAELQSDLDILAKQEPEIRSQLSGARQKADEARANLSNVQSQGDVLNGLMRLKESGRIEGFHGRLGNLGAIDQKFDVAISTACPALENLVVDTVEVGQQCIDYLRKNNLGRANIILLDRLAKRELGLVETPENVPRLFDLVKVKDEKLRPAFFSVLQNTLVAKDLDQANRIAYGARRWRVVTLDGQLIDISGTMSGGGTRVAKGGMSSKLKSDVNKEQVSKLEVDRDKLEQNLRDFQLRQRELEADLKNLLAKLPQIETAIQKIDLEIQSLEGNVSDGEHRIDELAATQSSSKADEARMATLEKHLGKLGTEVEKLRAETLGLEQDIQSLQNNIMEVGGVRLRSQKAKVDGLRDQIDHLNEEISNSEIAKSKAEKQKTKHEKSCAEADQELLSVAAELQEVTDEIKVQNNNVSGSRQRAEEAKEMLNEKQEELNVLKGELDGKIAELNETRAVEIEMRNKMEENQKVQAENHKRLNYWTEKLGKLVVNPLSDLGEEAVGQGLPQYTKDELEDLEKDALKGEIALLEERTQNTNVDLGVLEEYRRRVEEHKTRNADLQSAVEQRDSARKRCDEFRKLRLEGFMTGFSMISARLKEMYQMITMGGNAELELVDSLDPFSEGILFSVMPPKKSWKNISNLSGGEKTLSSLALVFALHHYKPTPLYVMDEIDAALDFRNVSIVASYIKERTKNAQFIVISLRNNMFELASRLIGVYKVNHMTKSVTVENRDYIQARA